MINRLNRAGWAGLPFCLTMAKTGFAVSMNLVSAQEKPNILWITIEDTSPQFVGCYGNKDARTPHIDRLAETGIRFNNAFSTGTVCSPSRTAIITGVKTYKTGTGNHRSYYSVPDFMKGFPYYLRQAGYYTSNNKKTDYNVAKVTRFMNEAWDESSDTAGWWNRKPGQPFFAVFNFLNSHQSRTMTMPFAWYQKNVLDKLSPEARIGDNDFPMPPFYKDSPEMRRQFARVYNSIQLTDTEIGDLLKRLEEDHLMDSTIIFFYADHGEGIPRGKGNGIDLGYRVPFVVWVPERFNELSPWGTGGVVTDDLVDFTDLAPTVIRLAGGEVPAQMTGRVLMGEQRSAQADHLVLSSDRMDNGIDVVRSVTDGRFMYSRHFMPFMPEARYIRYGEMAEITKQMRKDLADDQLNPLQGGLFQDRPPEFLYDLRNDPWETTNLADHLDYQPVLEKMRQQLKEEVLQARDVLFLPEYEIGLISQQTTPYEFRLHEANYPIAEIYRAAALSGFRGKEVVRQQVALLESPDKIVRYWAALGLRCQSSEDLMPFAQELEKAISDEYPPAAVTASAILWTNFGTEISGEKLKSFCVHSNWYIKLMAINYLLYADNRQPFVETIKQVNNMKGIGDSQQDYAVKAACLVFLENLGMGSE